MYAQQDACKSFYPNFIKQNGEFNSHGKNDLSVLSYDVKLQRS